jgi:hypothetical protein
MNPVNGSNFIRINSKDEQEIKILMRPEKIREIWQDYDAFDKLNPTSKDEILEQQLSRQIKIESLDSENQD